MRKTIFVLLLLAASARCEADSKPDADPDLMVVTAEDEEQSLLPATEFSRRTGKQFQPRVQQSVQGGGGGGRGQQQQQSAQNLVSGKNAEKIENDTRYSGNWVTASSPCQRSGVQYSTQIRQGFYISIKCLPMQFVSMALECRKKAEPRSYVHVLVWITTTCYRH